MLSRSSGRKSRKAHVLTSTANESPKNQHGPFSQFLSRITFLLFLKFTLIPRYLRILCRHENDLSENVAARDSVFFFLHQTRRHPSNLRHHNQTNQSYPDIPMVFCPSLKQDRKYLPYDRKSDIIFLTRVLSKLSYGALGKHFPLDRARKVRKKQAEERARERERDCEN